MRARENAKPSLMRRALACLLSAALCIAFTPAVAWGAEGDVDYLYCDEHGTDWKTKTKSAGDYTAITASSTPTDWAAGWYVVSGDVTINDRVAVSGYVYLILTDGCTLTVNGGIQVEGSNSLTVYAQSAGGNMGTLTVQGVEYGNAGIGGDHRGTSGRVIINGGTVTATGGWGGAGIGSGRYSSSNAAGIGICGGTVTATGGENAAGIGSGHFGNMVGAISIYGGTVAATGGSTAYSSGSGGEGIGNGRKGSAYISILINGGTVTATGGTSAAGIGDGFNARGNAVIFASSISYQKHKSDWRGVVFEGASCDSGETTFGGLGLANFGISQSSGSATVTIENDLTIASGESITVGENAALVVPEGKTLVNNGTITSNAGSIYVDGTLNGNAVGGKVYYPLALVDEQHVVAASYDPDIVVHDNKTYYNSNSGATLPVLSKTGYTFNGWKYGGAVVANDTTYAALTPSGDVKSITLTAQWTINQYTITFEPNGGSGVAPITQNYDTAVTAPANPTREGYTFAGWDKEIPDTMPAEDTIITAQWTINQYTITFEPNGGTINSGNVDSYTYGVETTLPTDVTKTGYTFLGWYDGGDNKVTEIAAGNTGDKTLYAHWAVNQYTITFNTDGGSEVAPITKDYDTAITAPENPTKTGYTFAGWSPELPKTMPVDGLAVTAQWAINEYTVAFNTAGGTTITDKTDVIWTDKVLDGITDPTRDGYTFNGWKYGNTTVAADTTYAELADDDTVASIELTAQWKINQYTITFDTDGGSEIAPITQDYGTAITAPADPTRSGYRFAGWDKEIPDNMPAENITITAKWQYVPPATPQASADCIKAIDALPDVDAVTLESGEAIQEARSAYDALTVYQKSFVSSSKVAKLEAVEARHSDLVAVAPVEAALEALPQAGELKAKDAKVAAKAAEAALAQVAGLTEAQQALVDGQLVANAQAVVAQAADLVAEADAKAVKKVKDKKLTVKAGKSKSITFKTKVSAAGTKVVYKKSSGSKYISVTKSGKVTAKKGMKKGKTYKAKVKVTCGKSTRYVKVVVRVR